jgi:threonine dehydrogenase-like Zn-dependent dehydrogenase
MSFHPALSSIVARLHISDRFRSGCVIILIITAFSGTPSMPAQAAPMNTGALGMPLVFAPAKAASSVPAFLGAGPCYATFDGITIFESANANAVQDAVDAASAGGTVKVAGTCAGTQTRGGSTQSVILTKTLTLAGGYTTTNWTISDPIAHPTVLDALAGGRVISATQPVTISSLTVQRGQLLGGMGAGGHFLGATTLNAVTFISNTSVQGGGARVEGEAVVLNSTFANNTANNIGGGAWFSNKVSISGTTFISNSQTGAFGAGGGLYIENVLSFAAITNTSFISNASLATLGKGGGLYGVPITLLFNVVFTRNHANDIGGGAYFGRAPTLQGTRFFSNTATNAGGGAYFSDGASISSTHFISNFSSGGGGFYSFRHTFVTSTHFISNAGAYGAGAYFYGPGNLWQTSFTANRATNNGGGAYFEGAAVVTDSLFNGNLAPYNGGGVYFKNAALVSGSTFTGNIASNTLNFQGRGGGVFIDSFGTITGTSFTGNQARAGGGLYVNGSFTNDTTRVVNSLFSRNTASTGNGDAINLIESTFYSPIVDVIFTTIASPTVSTGKALVAGKGTINITNTIIASHTVGIGQTGSAIVNSNYNLFFSNGADTAGSVTSGANNVNGDPAFANPATDDYRIPLTSPAVNAGIDLGISNDYFGNARPYGAGVDIGFNESTPPPISCYATPDDGINVFSSTNADAIQQAIDAANAGGTVKIAGTCAGVQSRGSTTQTAYISKTLTLAGGFTLTNWNTSDPLNQPTTLDAQGNGRVLFATAPVTISNLNLKNGTSTGNGGGGFFGEDASVNGASFTGNNAGGNGGGAWFDKNGNLNNSHFGGNNSGDSGGGAGFGGSSALTGTTFMGNTTGNLGGGAFFSGTANLNSGAFTGNSAINANSKGGGAYFGDDANLNGAGFNNNSAANGGGAWFVKNGNVNNSNFGGNSSGDSGGGAGFGGTAVLTGTTFTSNTTGNNGGGAFFGGLAFLNDGSFDDNAATHANSNGGGAYFNDDGNLNNTGFNNNSAAHGGGAYFAKNANGDGNNFGGNTAGNDGGGAVFSGTAVLSDTAFMSNTAGNNGGGAFFNNTANLNGTGFNNNTAGGDGGGAFFNNTANLNGNDINGNGAGGDGGGLYLLRSSPASQISNNSFSSNRSGSGNGDAMYLFGNGSGGGTANIFGNTIGSQPAGSGAAIVAGDGTTYITNSVIASHTVGISQTEPAIVNEDNNSFRNNTDHLRGNINSGGNSTFDPPLNNGGDGGTVIPPGNVVITLKTGIALLQPTSDFTATLISGDEPVTYTWNFGDGSLPYEGRVASHVYAPGIYTATLTAANSAGTVTTTFRIFVPWRMLLSIIVKDSTLPMQLQQRR